MCKWHIHHVYVQIVCSTHILTDIEEIEAYELFMYSDNAYGHTYWDVDISDC